MDERFYHAIRDAGQGNDPDHVVFVEAVWDYGNLPTTSQYGWTNVVYEFHQYLYGHDGDVSAQEAAFQAKIDDWLRHRGTSGWDTPYLMGEFSLFTANASWKYALRGMNDNRMSWSAWTYKATSATS